MGRIDDLARKAGKRADLGVDSPGMGVAWRLLRDVPAFGWSR
jgi:hypothetical protein